MDSVFGREIVLHIGMATYILASLINFMVTQDRGFLAFPVFLFVVFVYRLYIFRAYAAAKHEIASTEEVGGWENHYIHGSVGATLGLGFMGGYSALFYPNSIATTICLGVVIGTMLTVVGRNFGSIRNVRYMAIACCAPMMIGFVWGGVLTAQAYLFLAALLLVSVYATSMQLARYLRSLLMKALTAARASEITSKRFNIAISSMPNGLIMVDGDGRVVVVNARASEALGISTSYCGLLEDALRTRFDEGDVALISLELAISVTENEYEGVHEFEVETIDGRWLQLEFRKLDATDDIIFDEDTGGKHDGAAILIIQDITDKVRSKNDLELAARFDKLTGIPNRSWWETLTKEMVGLLPPKGIVSLCILDVDRFKLINDTLGHHIGDEVIAGVAARLNSIGDRRMVVGRLGGDEFVVLFGGLATRAEANDLHDRVFGLISSTYEIDGHNIDVRCSGGVIVRERQEFNLHADMSRADMALYKVKRNPNQAWMLFDEAMEEEYISTSRIKHDLKDAIAQGTLEVVYQPIFDVSGDRMVSTEALCRWKHYEAGYIPPSQFVAMAEEIGVIGKLTEYVLRTACRDCSAWGADVAVSVNLSALDLARDDIVGMIRKALDDFDLPASCLCIEVTETVFVKDFAKTAATLRTLKGMGVKTSLDDFGTGYSSLSYLGRLPVSRVKIDRSFVLDIVKDPKVQRLFRGTVSLAKELEFEIIVEGVEAADQLEYVRAVPGVDMIQGYIFSKVVTVEKMVDGYELRNSSRSARDAWVPRLVGR
ncbi:bifunctional diguanylate cyclase/phosphodiesterase [Pararhizobium sp. BT-229]|uniref:putative bifunctional diguanylate cyclase/phosphodiesterase n=1 Tax=Pararhizobium sp. BT-229 TaxID=2986923 RepID=UPI0021F7CA36|nr:bifunctional diguanylate cyclase/phosphodiesterase [Pararhizobium sp. BT-229]MCV9964699.1 bifunctional diguanylate cyclase/phosphodiesterase [Pararhizobium sp. BT-229]